MAVLLDHGVDNELCGAGGVVVGEPDQTLVFGLEQILPILRSFKVEAGELIGVDHEAEDSLVDAVPVAVRVAVHVADEVGGVLGLVSLEQTLCRDDVVRVGRAAKPDVSGRIAVLFLYLGLHLTGGQTLIGSLDAVELLEVLAGGCEIFLFAGAVNNELTLRLSEGDEILFGGLLGVRVAGVLRGSLGGISRGSGSVAAGAEREHHHECQQHCQILFHVFSSV